MLQNNLSESLNATAMLLVCFSICLFCCRSELQSRVDSTGAAVDSFSDIKGKKPHYSVTCYLFQIQFRGDNVFPGTLLCLSWEKNISLILHIESNFLTESCA